tara:strand:- start:7647 stop:9077 length:1431 start_codon:yes stop_codon:yes gene_type:complete
MKTVKKFDQKDQLDFAQASGDFNPVHVDPIYARRTLFGGQVVHGINLLLWALDIFAKNIKNPFDILFIKSQFHKPVLVNNIVEIEIEKSDLYDSIFILKLDDTIAAKIKIKIKIIDELEKVKFTKNTFPSSSLIRSPSINEIEKMSGDLELFFYRKFFKKSYKYINEFANHSQVATLLCSTNLVGTICPGKNSIYSSLEFTKNKEDDIHNCTYKISKVDKRINFISMKLKSQSLKGKINCFLRPDISKQPNYHSLKGLINEDQFSKQRILIIGGSRGLGEITAKILAMGGADVKISYFRGLEDAKSIVNEINANKGMASYFYFNILDQNEEELNQILKGWTATHIYYFPTPFIFSGEKNKFSKPLFDKFYDYYVGGFYYLTKMRCLNDTKNIFYPSSVSIDELPKDMLEYSLAKSAGESLCDYIVKNDNKYIYKPRLPRLNTDQTVTLLPHQSMDTYKIMIKEIKLFNRYIKNIKN